MVSFMDGYTQTVLVALICFSGPGLFNALTGLGGAGAEDPRVANYANALLYISFAIFGFFGGAIFNIFGNRILFFFGSLTYAIYVFMQFLAGMSPSLDSLAILSGGLLGLGAACLWTAQGASVLAYAPDGQQGKYISTFWIIFSLGGFFGGLLMFFGNLNQVSGSSAKASPLSYCIFLALMLSGPAISVTLLLPTAKVVKADGEPVIPCKAKSVGQEIKEVLGGVLDSNMHLMVLYFLMSNVGYAYFFNGINSLFNIRTRGLNSALFWLTQMAGTKIALSRLDDERMSKREQGRRFFWFVSICTNIAFFVGLYVQFYSEGGWDRDKRPSNRIDVLHFRRACIPMISLILFGLADSLIQTYGMWMNSGLANGSTDRMARYSGFSKSISAIGSALSWLVDLFKFKYQTQLFMCWSLFLVSLPPLLCATSRLSHNYYDEDDEYADEIEELKDDL